jgi:hypothetical protein
LRWDLVLEGKGNKQECRQDRKALGAFNYLLDEKQGVNTNWQEIRLSEQFCTKQSSLWTLGLPED